MKSDEQEFVEELFDFGVFRYGEFTLKSGQISKIYIDLRGIISNPSILRKAVEFQYKSVEASGINYDIICGVPYAALPLAAGICLYHEKPMIIRRKEAKDYGTKKLVEGRYEKGQKCLIVEDVVTKGDSILDTVELLRAEGLIVSDAVVLLDRQQGAEQKLEKHGIKLHAVLKLKPVIQSLVAGGKFTVEQQNDMFESLKDLVTQEKPNSQVSEVVNKWSFENRLSSKEMSENSKRLLQICEEKKTNLCLAIDLTSAAEILELVRTVGNEICMVKLHADIITDFNDKFWKQLVTDAKNMNFMIMEDRKFSDTGNTVYHQLMGDRKINEWANFVTVHSLPGKSVFMGVEKCISESENKFDMIIVAEMSSQGALTTHMYKNESLKLATQFRKFVSGFVCQTKCMNDPSFLYFTPGINIDESGDKLGQQFRSPEEAIGKQGNDVIIVGRAITNDKNRLAKAQIYRKAGWEAIMKRK